MHVSFFAVLTDGKHVVWTNYYSDEKQAKTRLDKEIVKQMAHVVDKIERFVFAYGSISQEYTQNEVRTEFLKLPSK